MVTVLVVFVLIFILSDLYIYGDIEISPPRRKTKAMPTLWFRSRM